MNANIGVAQIEGVAMETRRDILRRAGRIAAYALLAVLAGILLLVAAATVPVLFGYHTYNVNGGSMGPSLAAGSTAVTKPTSPQLLSVGDIIAYRAGSDSPHVLHRIVEIKTVEGVRVFVTQGDRNATPDPIPVALGGPGDRVVYSVPYAGYVLTFARTTTGKIVLIALPLALLAMMYAFAPRRADGRSASEILGESARAAQPRAPFVESLPQAAFREREPGGAVAPSAKKWIPQFALPTRQRATKPAPPARPTFREVPHLQLVGPTAKLEADDELPTFLRVQADRLRDPSSHLRNDKGERSNERVAA